MTEPEKTPDPNEPIRREEYERRHKALRSSYEHYARRSTRILRVLVGIGLVTGALSFYLLNENGQRTDETSKITKETSTFSMRLSKSIVESCRRNGNPLRKAVREFGGTLKDQLEKEIAQSKALEAAGTYEEIFPQYPPDKLHELIEKNRGSERKAVEEIKATIRTIEAVDCRANFPPPPKPAESAPAR